MILAISSDVDWYTHWLSTISNKHGLRYLLKDNPKVRWMRSTYALVREAVTV